MGAIKKKSVFPRFGRMTKQVIKAFLAGAKYYGIHAALAIIDLILIVWWLFDDDAWLEGAAGILFIYVFYNVIKLNAIRIRMKYLEKLLGDNRIDYDKS